MSLFGNVNGAFMEHDEAEKRDEVIMESGEKKYDFVCEKISVVNWPLSLNCAIFPVMSL